MIPLLDMRMQVRSAIDEKTSRAWDDYELNNWIYEGARDIGRRSETIQEYSENITVQAGHAKYAMPEDVIRIHRVEFHTSDQQYIVQASTYAEMDQYWGSWQSNESSYPSFYVLWGTPGMSLEMQLYPVPSQTGTLTVFYYRHPKKPVNDSDMVEIPFGWEDAVVLYCEYQAKRRDKDASWTEAKQLYEQALGNLIMVTRQWHDSNQSIIMGNRAIPSWLYEMEDY